MAGWMQRVAGGPFLAGVVAASALAAGPAAASTLLTQTLNLDLTTGSGGYAGQFNIASLLNDGQGRTYAVTGGHLGSTAFSNPNYGAPVISEPFPAFNIPTFVLNPDGLGFTIVNRLTHTRLITYSDSLPDVAGIHSLFQTDSQTAPSQLHTVDPMTTTTVGNDVFNDSVIHDALYGPFSLGFDLNATAVQFLNLTGAYDYQFTLFGQGTLENVSLSLDLVQTGGPPPGAGLAGVPEPGVWALMLLGFGGVGATLRARRRLAVPY